jgi:hypothetical protein
MFALGSAGHAFGGPCLLPQAVGVNNIVIRMNKTADRAVTKNGQEGRGYFVNRCQNNCNIPIQ